MYFAWFCLLSVSYFLLSPLVQESRLSIKTPSFIASTMKTFIDDNHLILDVIQTLANMNNPFPKLKKKITWLPKEDSNWFWDIWDIISNFSTNSCLSFCLLQTPIVLSLESSYHCNKRSSNSFKKKNKMAECFRGQNI